VQRNLIQEALFFKQKNKTSNRIAMKSKIVLLLLVVCGLQASAQDPEFSQFYASPIYTNPALAGTGQCNGGGRVVMNYRNQWPDLPGTLVTSAFSWDQQFEKIGGAFALTAMHDVAGEGLLTTSTFGAVYAKRIDLNKKVSLQWGIEGQYRQRSLDFSKLRFADQIVATRGFVINTQEQFIDAPIVAPNVNTGLVVFTDWAYAGVAVHNLIEPRQSFYGGDAVLPRRYTVHAGTQIALDKRKRSEKILSPNVLFMMQSKFTQLNFGFYFTQQQFITGLWYRQTFGEFDNSDALMMLVGFKKDNFRFGYSVDLTVSDARSAAPVSHEISASVYWCAKVRPPKIREFPCSWKN